MDLKNHQPPLSVDEQIQNLRNIGLIINDEEYAKAILFDISYFRLIKAFCLGLKPKNGNYYDGVTFEQMVNLYKFNCRIRQELFKIIERVEVNLRCRISNHFSCKYGVLGYENPDNFQVPEFHAEFLNDINQEIHRNAKSPFVRNFTQNYVDGKIPMYALVELFSFGTLSKFFKNMKNEDKKAIALTYGVGYTYFESWIESIANVRNLCAHYGRLYNAILSKTPKMYKQFSDKGIGNNRLYGVLICISLLVPNNDNWIEFVNFIEETANRYSYAKLETMGFPEDWKEILLDTRKTLKK